MMADDQSNPSELADRLDNAIPPGRDNPTRADGDPSVEAALRLAKAPHLTLAADKKGQILAQVLAAHQQTFPVQRFYRIPPRTPLLLAVASSVILIASVVVFIIIPALEGSPGGQGGERELVATLTNTPGDTLTATAEPTMVPTETATEEVVAPPPTSTSVPTATDEPTSVPTETAMVESSPETTALVQAEVTEEPDQDIGPAEVVVVGPVAQIQDNIIVIYDFEFVLEPDDPLLTAIQVDDVVRIEGDIDEQGGSFVVTAIDITVISTDIYIGDDGSVWRDTDNCQNPPPPQAPAHGWRERCEGSGSEGSGN
jgi:hypothetical protein